MSGWNSEAHTATKIWYSSCPTRRLVSIVTRDFLTFFLFLFLSFLVWPFLPIHYRCRGLLLYLVTLGDTDSVGLIKVRDQPVAETSTWQHTTLIRDRHPYRWRDSNPQSQQTNGRRPTPSVSVCLYETVLSRTFRQMNNMVVSALYFSL
jgi:hypothetical protein